MRVSEVIAAPLAAALEPGRSEDELLLFIALCSLPESVCTQHNAQARKICDGGGEQAEKDITLDSKHNIAPIIHDEP